LFGGEGEVTLERNDLKALASDTRVEILKKLKERNYTISELSSKLGHSKSTLHEHISKLVEANLVERADNHTSKWVYYRLSRKGRGLFVDSTNRVVVIFSTILLVVGVMQLTVFFTSLSLLAGNGTVTPIMEQGQPLPGIVSKSYAVPEATPVSEQGVSRTGQQVPPIKQPSREEEKKVATEEESVALTLERIGLKPIAHSKEELPYYFYGGIGFLCAGFILVHYYHAKQLGALEEKSAKKARSLGR